MKFVLRGHKHIPFSSE